MARVESFVIPGCAVCPGGPLRRHELSDHLAHGQRLRHGPLPFAGLFLSLDDGLLRFGARPDRGPHAGMCAVRVGDAHTPAEAARGQLFDGPGVPALPPPGPAFPLRRHGLQVRAGRPREEIGKSCIFKN